MELTCLFIDAHGTLHIDIRIHIKRLHFDDVLKASYFSRG